MLTVPPSHVFVVAFVATADDPGAFGWHESEADVRSDYEQARTDGGHGHVRLIRVDLPAQVRAEMRALARTGEPVCSMIDSYLDWIGVHLPEYDAAREGALLDSYDPGAN